MNAPFSSIFSIVAASCRSPLAKIAVTFPSAMTTVLSTATSSRPVIEMTLTPVIAKSPSTGTGFSLGACVQAQKNSTHAAAAKTLVLLNRSVMAQPNLYPRMFQ